MSEKVIWDIKHNNKSIVIECSPTEINIDKSAITILSNSELVINIPDTPDNLVCSVFKDLGEDIVMIPNGHKNY